MPALNPNSADLVYFARRADGAIKIGTTRHLPTRLKSLRRRFGEVDVIATYPGDSRSEASLHRELAAHRLDGEWFSPVADVVSASQRGDPANEGMAIDDFLRIEQLTAGDVRAVTRTMLAGAIAGAGVCETRSEAIAGVSTGVGASEAWVRRLLRGDTVTVTPAQLFRVAEYFRACCSAMADRARKQISISEQNTSSVDRLMRLFDGARPAR